MKWLLSAILGVIALAALAGSNAAAPGSSAGASGPAVLVELYTSQGCSSCPPADGTLREIAADDSYRGRVVPLAFHVDYWNRLGWKDPFSSSAWSERQRDYSRAWHVDRVYTPQAIVAGASDVVGSNDRELRRSIDAALGRPEPVHLSASARIDGSAVALRGTVEISGDLPGRDVDIVAAVFENGFETDVRRGENGGRTLRNDFVVRRLVTVATIGSRPGSKEVEASIPLDSGWKRDRIGVAVFLQDPVSRHVFGALAVPATQ